VIIVKVLVAQLQDVCFERVDVVLILVIKSDDFEVKVMLCGTAHFDDLYAFDMVVVVEEWYLISGDRIFEIYVPLICKGLKYLLLANELNLIL